MCILWLGVSQSNHSVWILEKLILESNGVWESNEEAERIGYFLEFSIRKIRSSDLKKKKLSCLEDGDQKTTYLI